MLFTRLTTVASLFAFALASPVPESSLVLEAEVSASPDADAVSTIVKRAEGVHLVNCNRNSRDIYSAVVVSFPALNYCKAVF